jgi:hypothetical protein
MKTALVCVLGAVCAHAETESFDKAAGSAPPGWSAAVTGKGRAKWVVERDDTAPSKPNVLKQSAEGDYPIILHDSSAVKDGFVEVKGKTLAGKEDQVIGILWRATDKNNYYVCRANALEGNVVLYKTVAGKRSSLDIVGRQGGYGVKTTVEPLKWHALRVDFAGDTFIVRWNGKELFQVKDATFAGPGKAGLWTKADSVTIFDDFSFGTK